MWRSQASLQTRLDRIRSAELRLALRCGVGANELCGGHFARRWTDPESGITAREDAGHQSWTFALVATKSAPFDLPERAQGRSATFTQGCAS
jgi:hypothetical protein